MKVFIVGKTQFDAFMRNREITNDNVEENIRTFFISINDTSGTPEVPYFNGDKSNVKVLFFDDVEKDLNIPIIGTNQVKTSKAFTIDQGISRSGAVGTFVNDYFKADYEEFKRNNPNILPNGQVLAMLNSLLR